MSGIDGSSGEPSASPSPPPSTKNNKRDIDHISRTSLILRHTPERRSGGCVSSSNSAPTSTHRTAGRTCEKIVIPKTAAFITFLGSPDSLTTITGNDTAATKGADGRPMSTFRSSTVAVNANYFIAANIKFENTAGIGGQAVAVRISGDKAAFYNCSFYGAQDTLYDHKGLHYFNNCFIQGSVDFIFGNGRSLYENCYLNSIAKNKASMTAQCRSNTTIESGFSFTKSTVSGSGLVYLGRPWGDRSRVVFSYTFMDKVVIPQGWNNWHIQRPEESGVYYGEYMCSGPGANWTGRVQWARQLTDEEAQPFLGTYYVYGDSWILGPPSL